jgi:hypothetical protein
MEGLALDSTSIPERRPVKPQFEGHRNENCDLLPNRRYHRPMLGSTYSLMFPNTLQYRKLIVTAMCSNPAGASNQCGHVPGQLDKGRRKRSAMGPSPVRPVRFESGFTGAGRFPLHSDRHDTNSQVDPGDYQETRRYPRLPHMIALRYNHQSRRQEIMPQG